MNYQLVAFDMDGTLLNSEKKILPSSVEAIERAAKAGKIVVLSTGRTLAELVLYQQELKHIRYFDCLSGGLVYDFKQQKAIYERTMDVNTVKRIFDLASVERTIPHIITERSILQRDHLPLMHEFQMDELISLFEWSTERWENLRSEYESAPFPLGKFNIYHLNPQARERTIQRILDAHLPVTMARAEITALEISPLGVDKGVGLQKLCEALDIPIEQTIAVGDAENDFSILQKAGLAVAMGNATDTVKALADVVVANCDQDGCAQVIDCFLLKD